MRLLIAFVALFISLQAFACTRTEAETIVKNFISQDFNRVETVRTLKLGTVTMDEFVTGETTTIVHAVVEVEKHGRKVSEQAIVFHLNQHCNVTSTHGALLQKVKFDNTAL